MIEWAWFKVVQRTNRDLLQVDCWSRCQKNIQIEQSHLILTVKDEASKQTDFLKISPSFLLLYCLKARRDKRPESFQDRLTLVKNILHPSQFFFSTNRTSDHIFSLKTLVHEFQTVNCSLVSLTSKPGSSIFF